MLVANKGFKMPETCFSCPMQFGGWCGVSPAEVDERVAETVEEAWIQKKPKWCPLVDADQKHAHWNDLGGIYACSNCGAEDGIETAFCSSCGYQMDGGDHDAAG